MKNVLFSDPVNGIKSQNSQQLFSVISPVMFWVQMHISWSRDVLSTDAYLVIPYPFSAFHVFSVYRHHLYGFPVMKASVSSSIWSLLPYSVFVFFFLLLSKHPLPSAHPRYAFVLRSSKVRIGRLARWDSALSGHRTYKSAPSQLLSAAGWKIKIKKYDNARHSESNYIVIVWQYKYCKQKNSYMVYLL